MRLSSLSSGFSLIVQNIVSGSLAAKFSKLVGYIYEIWIAHLPVKKQHDYEVVTSSSVFAEVGLKLLIQEILTTTCVQCCQSLVKDVE